MTSSFPSKRIGVLTTALLLVQLIDAFYMGEDDLPDNQQ